MGFTIDGLDTSRKKFRLIQDNTEIATKYITKKLADKLESKIYENYDNWWAQLKPSDFPEEHWIYTEKVERKSGVSVRVGGEQLLYDEFGTGDEGEKHPHPQKNKYGLNPYNSGEHIVHSNNGNYWHYHNTKTKGMKAGRFVYDASREVIYNDTPNELQEWFDRISK